MTQNTERLFTSLYFTNEKRNGVVVKGKFNDLRVRFLYKDWEQIPMGRAHLYEYSKGKYSKVLCLKDGASRKDIDKIHCPMCDVDPYKTPSSKLYAFVEDLGDDSKLKLFEFSWTLGKQLDAMAQMKGRPLHDIVFILKKSGTGKDTTYTPMPDETTKFSVADYFESLGIKDYPALVGGPKDRAAIMALSEAQMDDFIGGNYPWSDGEATTTRKYTSLTDTITIHNAKSDELPESFDEEPAPVKSASKTAPVIKEDPVAEDEDEAPVMADDLDEDEGSDWLF